MTISVLMSRSFRIHAPLLVSRWYGLEAESFPRSGNPDGLHSHGSTRRGVSPPRRVGGLGQITGTSAVTQQPYQITGPVRSGKIAFPQTYDGRRFQGEA